MDVVWGALMVVIGVFFIASSRMESQNFLYRSFVARARILWGDAVHRFLAVSGLAIAAVGVLVALGPFR